MLLSCMPCPLFLFPFCPIGGGLVVWRTIVLSRSGEKQDKILPPSLPEERGRSKPAPPASLLLSEAPWKHTSTKILPATLTHSFLFCFMIFLSLPRQQLRYLAFMLSVCYCLGERLWFAFSPPLSPSPHTDARMMQEARTKMQQQKDRLVLKPQDLKTRS